MACSVPKATADQPVLQGIEGYVLKVAGNQMPSPDMPPSKPPGIHTTIYIYEVAGLKDVNRVDDSPFYKSIHTKLIQSVESDSSGHFSVALPVGTYSLFTKLNGLFFAGSFDEKNNIAPVTVEENKVSKINIKMNAGAVY